MVDEILWQSYSPRQAHEIAKCLTGFSLLNFSRQSLAATQALQWLLDPQNVFE